MYIPIITPIIIALTTRPNIADVINYEFQSTVGRQIEDVGTQTGASEDRRGLLFLDPRINRVNFFKEREGNSTPPTPISRRP